MIETLTEPMTDKERSAKRKAIHSTIAKLRKDAAKGLQLGRDIAANKSRVKELDLSSKEAVILGRDSSVFDAEHRKIEDLLRHQSEAWKSLSGAQGEIARLQSELRGTLADPELQAELHIAKQSIKCAYERRSAANKQQIGISVDSPEYGLWTAEIEHAEFLLNEAGAEVDRLKAAIIAE